jgi:signal transduction histidine kinase
MNTGPRPNAPRWVDVALVLPVLAVVVIGTSQMDVEPGERAPDWLAYVCGIVGVSALVFWRRWAIYVTGVVATTMFVYLARNYAGGPAHLAGPLSLLALGYTAPRRVAWAGAAGLAAVAAVGGVIGSGFGLQQVIAFGWGYAAVLLGQAIAARTERASAERERVALAQEQALANERLRIAQDLHDSVAHAMATINVQSGVAAHLVERKPEQAAVALEAIRTASRDALDELGAILGVLRDQTSAAPLAPVAGIADVPGLVERARADGLAVSLTMTGDLTAMPTSIGTATFRVVQEGLTNTRRHAGPGATATVDLVVGEGQTLRVAVMDDGGTTPPPRSSAGAGFGLIGMRERVESTGGTLETGPAPGRGYRVVATWQPR